MVNVTYTETSHDILATVDGEEVIYSKYAQPGTMKLLQCSISDSLFSLFSLFSQPQTSGTCPGSSVPLPSSGS